MNTALTIERLYDMRLGPMAEAFSAELARTGDPALSFAERFGLVVEHQWSAREEGRLARRLKNAHLKIDASHRGDRLPRRARSRPRGRRRPGRAVVPASRRQRDRHRGHGPRQDLPRLRARRPGLPPRTHRPLQAAWPKLIFELALARADGSYLKALEKIAKVDLLDLDDWGLAAFEAQAANDLMDVVDDRAGRSLDDRHEPAAGLRVAPSDRRPEQSPTRCSTGSCTAPSGSS